MRIVLIRRRDGRVAEGARLESVFTRKGNVGSNPTLSAIQSELQRNSAAPHPEIRETCPYFAIFRPQTGLERKDCPTAKGATIRVFLWRSHEQSGFKKGIRRMQRDQKVQSELTLSAKKQVQARPEQTNSLHTPGQHCGWGDRRLRGYRISALECRIC